MISGGSITNELNKTERAYLADCTENKRLSIDLHGKNSVQWDRFVNILASFLCQNRGFNIVVFLITVTFYALPSFTFHSNSHGNMICVTWVFGANVRSQQQKPGAPSEPAVSLVYAFRLQRKKRH